MQRDNATRDSDHQTLFRVVYEEFAVEIERVVDLTDPSVREMYGVDREELTAPDWRKCQELAARLRGKGVEAVRTYSAADPRGRVVVVFVDLLRADSRVRVKRVRDVEARS